jgi:hypothetical protein
MRPGASTACRDEFYLRLAAGGRRRGVPLHLLRDHLRRSATHYGDCPAHDNLWSMCEKTKDDVVARMALVPRTLEARGLDATPQIQAKLRQVGTPAALRAVEILDIILRDEVGHVAIGNHWYRWLCERDGLDPVAHYEACWRANSGRPLLRRAQRKLSNELRQSAVPEWLSSSDCGLAGAFEVLDEIASETGETVALSIENNYSAQCVKVVPGRRPTPVEIPVGLRAPLTRSAAGLAVLMAKTDGQAMTSVQKSRELASSGTESYSQTMKTVHQFRREGRALVYGRLWPDDCWISVPTTKTYNMVPVTISAGGSLATMKRREDAVTLAMLSAISRWRS